LWFYAADRFIEIGFVRCASQKNRVPVRGEIRKRRRSSFPRSCVGTSDFRRSASSWPADRGAARRTFPTQERGNENTRCSCESHFVWRIFADFAQLTHSLSAFIDDFARPSGVLGPVDLRLLSWFAAI